MAEGAAISRRVVYRFETQGVKRVGQDITRLDAKLGKNTSTALKAAAAVQEYGAATLGAGTAAQQAADAVEANTGATTKATASAKRAGGAFGGMAAQIAAAATAVLSVNTAFQTIKKAVDFGIGFERGFNKLRTLSEEVSAETGAALEDLAADIPQKTWQVLDAGYDALSVGVKESQLAETLKSTSDVARAAVSDLPTALNLLTVSTINYEKQGLTAAHAADVFFQVFKKGKAPIDQLSASIGNVIPTAARAGVAFEETGAAIAAMTKSTGGQVAENVTRLRSLIEQLQKPAEETRHVLDALGDAIGVKFDANRLRKVGLQQTLIDIERAAAKTGVGLESIFRRTEASQALMILAGEGAATFADALDATTNAAGATEHALSKIKGDTQDVIDSFSALSESVLTRMGKEALPLVREQLERIAVALRENGPALAEGFGKVLTTAVRLAEWAATESGEIISAVNQLGQVGSSLASAFGGMGVELGDVLDLLGQMREAAAAVTPGVEQISQFINSFRSGPERVQGGAISDAMEGLAAAGRTAENLAKMPAILSAADEALQRFGVDLRGLYVDQAEAEAAADTITGRELAEKAKKDAARRSAAAAKAKKDAEARAAAEVSLARQIEDRRTALLSDIGARRLEQQRIQHGRQLQAARDQGLATLDLERVQAAERAQLIADEAARVEAARRQAQRDQLAEAEAATTQGPLADRIAAIESLTAQRIELVRSEADEQIRIAREAGVEITGLQAWVQAQITKTIEDGARARIAAYAAEADAQAASIATAAGSVAAFAKAVGASARVYAGIKVVEEGALAASETAKAAGSFAVWDIPGGIAHTAAAGLHVAAAVKWGADALGGGGGRSSGGGAGAGAGGAAPVRTRGSLPSRLDVDPNAVNRTDAAGARASVTVNVQGALSTDRQIATAVRSALAASEEIPGQRRINFRRMAR